MNTHSPYITLPLTTATEPDETHKTVMTLAECRANIDITVAGRTIRYRTDDDPITAVLATAAVQEAYPDAPAIGRLMLDSATHYHQWQQAVLQDKRLPGSVPPEFLHRLHRTYLLLRACALDLVAVQSPCDIHSTAQCAQDANRLRRLDGLPAAGDDGARRWLRDAYRDWLENVPHAWDCPGGCGGTGEVMQILIWQDDDGVPLHQEPMDCHRGVPQDPHPDSCVCEGTGITRERGERHLCLGGTDYDLGPTTLG